MAKFSQLVPNKTPWDASITQYPEVRITLYAAEPIETSYGAGFLVTAEVHDEPFADGETLNLLVGQMVLVDQLGKLLTAMHEAREDFPVDVMLERVKSGRSKYSYYQFIDPDDTPEG